MWLFIGVFIGLFLFPLTFPLSVIYLIWMYIDRNTPKRGGRKLNWLREMKYWHYFRDFFPISLVRHPKAEFDPNANYLFVIHPHGIISIGAFCNFATESTGFSQLFPGIDLKLFTLSGNFRIPLYREYLMGLGLGDVSRESCDYHLNAKPGSSIGIVVGGAAEALDARPGTADLYLRKRKGFVKVGLNNGASLVPVFSFGENDVFDQMVTNPPGSKLRRIQTKLLSILGFSLPLFKGRGVFTYDFGLLPYRKPITTVVGTPIKLPKNPNPDDDTINHWHSVYIKSLKELYDQYKDVYDKNRRKSLEIIE